MRSSFTHSVPSPVDQVVSAYQSTEFFLATLKHAGAVTIEILEERAMPDGGRFWKAKISESSRVPEFLRASDVDIYINESTFRARERSLEWKISPHLQMTPIVLTGEIRLVETARGTDVNYEVNLEVRIPLIGPKLEEFGLRRIGIEFRKQAQFLKSWLDR